MSHFLDNRTRIGGVLLVAVAIALSGCTAKAPAGSTTAAPSSAAEVSAGSTAGSATLLPPVYLADMHPIEGTVPVTGTVQINGKSYDHSIVQPAYLSVASSTQTQYDLGRRCDRITLTAGLTDDSTSSGTVQFDVYGDDKLLASMRLDFGQDSVQSLPVTDVLRLRLLNNGVKGSSGTLKAAWGDAAVVCHQ